MHFQRLTAFVVAFALAAPLSAFHETRTRQRTDLAALAADLERVLGPGHVVLSGRAPVPLPRSERAISGFEQAVVDAMNRERLANGRAALKINQRLELAADDRISDMMAKHYFEHVSPDGIEPWAWADKRGYAYREIGENLAVGYRSAEAVVNGWMHSPGHRANLLNASFEEVGVAIAPASPERRYAGPTVVALYGER